MSDLPLQAGCCCVDPAKGMTSSSVDLPLLLPSPPLLQPCTTQGINKHTTGSIQQLAAYLYKEKQKHTHRETASGRLPFSMQAWSYLRSTNSEMHSLLLVFKVLVATMVTVLICPGVGCFPVDLARLPGKRRQKKKRETKKKKKKRQGSELFFTTIRDRWLLTQVSTLRYLSI